ncbi:hypothetical protein DBR32_04595 [Taibaiella sp. KBW10]|uniref:hypothetical protein n=1 Tax=Taibaiella sp. KBW10 TaxID=2153357 RepID=UPI000F59F476|nr:hypothetical protein [Taibaiella sp. KBW10]RQO31253.1 hypothetical protein DBR32_04595 [Taibaiella sp. KBW10]
MTAPLFEEKQKFTQWWLYALLLLPLGVMIYKILVNGSYNLVSTLIQSLVLLLIVGFIFMIRLETRISEEGISVRLFPFMPKPKQYDWDMLHKVYVRQYSPLAEYGGWGLRYSLKNGRAYNIKGDKGIQLELKDGHKLLIGTQKEEAVQQILALLNKN